MLTSFFMAFNARLCYPLCFNSLAEIKTQITQTPVSATTDIQIAAKPKQANRMTKALTASAKMMLPLMVRIVARAILTAAGSCFRLPDERTISLDSIAASLPRPIAAPQSLAASTGASLMPSPTKQTVWPSSFISATFSGFWSGRSSE